MAWTKIAEKIIGIIETFFKNLNETIKLFFVFKKGGGGGGGGAGWLNGGERRRRRDD